jgi:hypothetical protein
MAVSGHGGHPAELTEMSNAAGGLLRRYPHRADGAADPILSESARYRYLLSRSSQGSLRY